MPDIRPIADPFDLPVHRRTARIDALVDADRAHFTEIARSLDAQRAELTTRIAELRRSPGGAGEQAMERDLEIRRLSGRLRLLQRYGADLCLGRMTPVGGEPVYLGRVGLSAADGRRLLIDWRAPAAEPYFAATHADPRGLAARRRYRWTGGRVTDFWDEAFTDEARRDTAALDDQSAFIAGLSASRSPRMRDVLSTIQADQHAIVRDGSRGALVIDGGPGTGKTVVALHRAAHLLYAEPHLTRGGGGLLFVGPHAAYLAYVDDVLPNLGETSVRMCTLRDLVPEGADAGDENDRRVAALKEDLDPVAVVDRAVRYHEQPPARPLQLDTPWGDAWIDAADWAEAFDAADPDAPHNEARDAVWQGVLDILLDQLGEAPVPAARRWLARDEDLARTFARAWPLLDPRGVVADLWSSPAYLRLSAPRLDAAAVELLQRDDARAWTVADLPLLDAARQRIGDPDAVRQRHRREAVIAAAQDQVSHVVDHLVESDDSEMQVMSILRGQDARNVLQDVDAPPPPTPDALAGPFGHIVVDEAQELTDAQWRMLARRCPSGSLTIVGDRAQARHGFTESWAERLRRVGLRDVRVASLTVNYRTPSEIMAEAAPVIRAAIPDANVPTSVRSIGVPVEHGSVAERDAILERWLAAHAEGIACVIGDDAFAATDRVRSLSPVTAKGLEFDLVVLVAPERFGDGVEGAVDRYVAMTRATGRLAVLSGAER
ncbi:RNA polymerase recycling motor ATPase HelR [Microbacterium sp. No. 7]|uniref:RNA polymerase recycling motor ATPase HelR n=1 Tax=Microbacterium sp. No. 7 TaxID=1714373 RepID=UPI0006D12C4A|nr:RNA polymerase recycling motor ATPase HelR [Microbacterium sp. No. 7]ALJ19986.1 AAA family ATPase [Microbacterium sp. No. 7]